MSDTPKVSAAEALEAFHEMQRFPGDLDVEFPTSGTVLAFLKQAAALESAASRPEGKVLHEGWAAIMQDSEHWPPTVECVKSRAQAESRLDDEGLHEGVGLDRIARVVVTELPDAPVSRGALPEEIDDAIEAFDSVVSDFWQNLMGSNNPSNADVRAARSRLESLILKHIQGEK